MCDRHCEKFSAVRFLAGEHETLADPMTRPSLPLSGGLGCARVSSPGCSASMSCPAG